MTEDRRETDKIILDELRNLQKDVGSIQVNLALNTQETARLAKYQEFQNGRVAAHEARMQVIEGAQAITSTAVAQIKTDEEDKKKSRRSDYDKLKWIFVGLAITFIGNVILFLIRSDILKKIYSQ